MRFLTFMIVEISVTLGIAIPVAFWAESLSLAPALELLIVIPVGLALGVLVLAIAAWFEVLWP